MLNLAHWRNRQLAWYVVLPLLGLIILLFGMLLSRNAEELRSLQNEEAVLRVQLSGSQDNEQALRLQLSSVSSSETQTAQARSLSFVSPSEICFHVENAEELDKYTKEEWAVVEEEYWLSH